MDGLGESAVTEFQRVLRIATELPDTELSESWGTTSVKACGKMLLRQHEEQGLTVLKVGKEDRDALNAERPNTFIVTPHYEKYTYMLVRTADLDDAELRELIIEGWRLLVPKTLAKAYLDKIAPEPEA
jgi:hypothetical protein